MAYALTFGAEVSAGRAALAVATIAANLAGIQVDRRILADLAITEPATFAAIVATAKAALPADTSAPKVKA